MIHTNGTWKPLTTNLTYDFLQGTATQPRQALPTKVLTIPEVLWSIFW